MLHGSFVATITPFTETGEIDQEAFQNLIDWQIKEGSHGIVVAGTTGESLLLSPIEYQLLIRLGVEAAAGRVPVIAGVAAASTTEAVQQAKQAQTMNATAVMAVTPFYVKPNQRGLYSHYKAIHDTLDIPLILYDNPGRTNVTITLDTLHQLCALPNILGIKDATGDLSRVIEISKMPRKLWQFSGNDDTAFAFVAYGGDGWISVTANVMPRLCADLYTAWRTGDLKKTALLQDRLMPIHKLMFREPSPAPVKYAAELLGLCRSTVRSPLCPVSPEMKDLLRREFQPYVFTESRPISACRG